MFMMKNGLAQKVNKEIGQTDSSLLTSFIRNSNTVQDQKFIKVLLTNFITKTICVWD